MSCVKSNIWFLSIKIKDNVNKKYFLQFDIEYSRAVPHDEDHYS